MFTLSIAAAAVISSIVTILFLFAVKSGRRDSNSFLRPEEKDEMLNYVAETIRNAFFVVSNDWRNIHYLSPAYEKIYGLDTEKLYINPEALLGIIHPEDLGAVKNKIRSSLNDSYFEEFPDYRILKSDGEIRWIATRIFPVKDENGIIRYITGMASDITEDKLEKIEHYQQEKLYRSIINNTQDVIYRADINGNIVMISPSACRVLGYEPGFDFTGLNIAEQFYYNKEDRDALIRILQEKGEVTDYETFLKKKDGTPVIVSTSSHFYYDDNGEIAGVEGVVRDITDRKRAEDLFNKAFFNNPCNMTISEISTGRIIEANNAWLKTLEFERDEVIGRTPSELKIYRNIEDRNSIIESVMKNGAVANLEIDFLSKNGEIQKSLFFSEVVEVAGMKVMLSSGINLTEQRAAEESLRVSEERFRRLAENAPDVIYRMKLPEGIYEYMSPSSERVIGYKPEEVYAKPMLIADAIHPQWRDYFREEWNKLLEGEVSPFYEYKTVTPDGVEKWLHQRNVLVKDNDGKPVALEGIVTDITERKTVEEELILKNAILSAEQQVSQDGIIIVDRNGKTLLANKRFAEIWHIPDELIAEGDDEKMLNYAITLLVNPDEFMGKVNYLYEHVDENSSDEVLFKDGRIIDRYSAPVKTDDGTYLGRVWYFRDITERKSAEEKLKNEQLFSKSVIDALPGIFYMYSYPELRLVRWNDNHEKLLGFNPGEIDGKDLFDWHLPENREGVKLAVETAMITGDNIVEAPLLDKNLNPVPFILTGRKLEVQGETFLIGIGIIITELKKAQDLLKTLNEEITAANEELMATNEEFEAQNEELIATNYELEQAQKMLKESEKEYRSLIENFSAGIIVFNSDKTIILSNPNASKILGLPGVKMADKGSYSTGITTWGEDGVQLGSDELPVDIVFETGKAVSGMVIGLSYNTGKINKWIICDAYPEFDNNGRVVKVIATFIDITQRKQAEEQIQTLKNYLRNIIDSIPDILVGVDPDMNITLINRRTEKVSGVSMDDALGNPVQSVLVDFEPFIHSMKSSIEKGQISSVPDLLVEKNGEKRYYNLVLYPLIGSTGEGAVIRIEDITDMRHMDEHLRQAQKMETVGNLAGGLAHDFNNVLSGIVGTVSLIKHLMNKEQLLNEKFTNYIDIIDRSGKRAAEMVQQLLTLSRRYEVALRPVDLNNSLRNVMQICHNTFDKSVEIKAEFSPEKAIINGDPAQIEQVILNLSVNAAHAMTIMRPKGEEHGGTLTVSIRHIKADRYFCSIHPEAKQGWYWMISHSDTGVGMDEDTMKSIFDPFFSTKERDQGTGLGLSMTYSIIHHHNGFIDVYSEKGIGSTFSVYLPESSEVELQEQHLHEHAAEKGEGTILVVDDEEVVRLMAESILKECGYNVIIAENGREGVDIFRSRNDVIDGVLLDMAMPGMSGKEVFIELRKIDSGVKVLLASGFRQDYRVDEALRLGITGFIQKPYSLVELSKKIKEIVS